MHPAESWWPGSVEMAANKMTLIAEWLQLAVSARPQGLKSSVGHLGFQLQFHDLAGGHMTAGKARGGRCHSFRKQTRGFK